MRKTREFCYGRLQNNALGAWIQEWWSRRGREVTDSLFYYWNMDSPYVGCFDKSARSDGYGKRIRRLGSILCLDWQNDTAEVIWFLVHMNGLTFSLIGIIGLVTSILKMACTSILAEFSWAGTTWNSLPYSIYAVSAIRCASVVLEVLEMLLRPYSSHSFNSGVPYELSRRRTSRHVCGMAHYCHWTRYNGAGAVFHAGERGVVGF